LARLSNPISGTVVRCEGDLAAHYLSLGWVDTESTQQAKATSEKPQAKRGRPRKTE